jgi:hypothetical protein
LGRQLDFDDGVCVLQAGERERIDELIDQLGVSCPQWDLFRRLSQLAVHSEARLTSVDFELLGSLLQRRGGSAEVFATTERWLATGGRQVASASGQPSGREVPSSQQGLRVLITPLADSSAGDTLLCHWPGDHPPVLLPDVLLRLVDEDFSRLLTWGAEGRSLDTEGLDLTGAHIGWIFRTPGLLEVFVDLAEEVAAPQAAPALAGDAEAMPVRAQDKAIDLLKRVGIEISSQGRTLAVRVQDTAFDLLWEIYSPTAVRVRGVRENLALEVETALAGEVPVVPLGLPRIEDGALLLDLQWLALPPDDAPSAEVWLNGVSMTTAWYRWSSDDLPKTLWIDATNTPANGGLKGAAVVASYTEDGAGLRVWIEGGSPEEPR